MRKKTCRYPASVAINLSHIRNLAVTQVRPLLATAGPPAFIFTMSKSVPQLLVGGAWVNAPRQLPVVDPYTGEEFGCVPMGDAATVDAAIAAA